VDDRATLQRLCDRLLGGDEHAPATKNFLEQLIKREGRERIWPARNASHSDAGVANE
jgi:hypothetical protein